MRNLFRRYPKKDDLSINTRKYLNPIGNTGDVVTLDTALELIDKKNKKKRLIQEKHKFRPTTLKDVFNIAHAISCSQASKDKIRMPIFSIQQKEI